MCRLTKPSGAIRRRGPSAGEVIVSSELPRPASYTFADGAIGVRYS